MTAKQEFTDKISDLLSLEKKIDKKHKRVIRLIDDFRNITSPEVQIGDIRSELVSQLVKLQDMMQEVKEMKESSSSDSLSMSRSFEDVVKLPPKPANIIIPSENPRKNSAFSPNLRESVKSVNRLNSPGSILEDPEIMALISKNRDKLFKKATK
ncbi:hypothetical protein SteCoe_12944 [Stentor coeruleus]|uniref:Uncharacterized protein n=1 Tax=Stentor coeruleus TaxID=5963 RepID=A0A1R2C9I5_9CILI|nr:hypothetical protein SteCoe_12944 [Stentor coeruleus]